MSVRMRMTSSKTGSRRAHHAADAPSLTAGERGPRRRHFVDPQTGSYRGKEIKDLAAKHEARAARRAKRRAAAGAEAAESAASRGSEQSEVSGGEEREKKE